ncbi:MAG: Sec-independent protein translocase protein TatB [Pseudomonadota bacterium]
MFDIAWTEILMIAVIAIIVVGPKELPSMLRAFGKTFGQVRRTAREFQSTFNDALREAERQASIDDVKQSINEVKNLDPTKAIKNELSDAKKALDETVSDAKDATTSSPAPSETATTSAPTLSPAPPPSAAPADAAQSVVKLNGKAADDGGAEVPASPDAKPEGEGASTQRAAAGADGR